MWTVYSSPRNFNSVIIILTLLQILPTFSVNKTLNQASPHTKISYVDLECSSLMGFLWWFFTGCVVRKSAALNSNIFVFHRRKK